MKSRAERLSFGFQKHYIPSVPVVSESVAYVQAVVDMLFFPPSTNGLESVYNQRAESMLSNTFLYARAKYYGWIMVPIVRNYIIHALVFTGKNLLEGVVVERGSGGGHKTLENILQLTPGKFYTSAKRFGQALTMQIGLQGNTQMICIEPSQGMREVAQKKLQGYPSVEVRYGYAEELDMSDESVSFVIDIQMQHHHDDAKKREMIQEAFRVLKKGGTLYIVDTFVPPDPNLSGEYLSDGVKMLILKIQQGVFGALQKIYQKGEGGGEYHNHPLQDTIDILKEEGFEINVEYSRGFKVGLGWILGFDFVTQIIAVKPDIPDD